MHFNMILTPQLVKFKSQIHSCSCLRSGQLSAQRLLLLLVCSFTVEEGGQVRHKARVWRALLRLKD